MSQAGWELLDHQTLRVIHLMLAKNIAFNILEGKMLANLMKAWSDMYEKPLAFNKVYLMYCSFNLKMNESIFGIDHVNEFNLIASRLSSVDISLRMKFVH